MEQFNLSVWNINPSLCFLADTDQFESLINNLIILGKKEIGVLPVKTFSIFFNIENTTVYTPWI